MHTHTHYVCKYTCIFEMIAEACFILYIIIDERESLCCTRHRKPHMSRKTQRKKYKQQPVASYLHLLCISASRTNSCQWFQGAFIQTKRHPLAKFNQEEAHLEIRNLCMMTSRRGEKQQMFGAIVKSTLRSRNEKNQSAESLWVPAEQRNVSWMPSQVRKTTRTDHTELVSSAWWKQIFSCKQASAATAEAWSTQTSCRGSTEPVP